MEEHHRQLIDRYMNELVENTDYELIKNDLLSNQVLTQVMVDNIESDTKGKNEAIKLKTVYSKVKHRGPNAFQLLLNILSRNSYERAFTLLSSSTVPAHSYGNGEPFVTEENRFLNIKKTRENLNFQRQQSNNNNSNNSNGQLDEQNNNNNNASNNETNSDGGVWSKRTHKLEPYTVPTSFKIENLEVKKAQEYGKHNLLPVYSMRSRRRGVFFFVNIIKFQDPKTNRRGAERDHDNLVTLFRELGFTIFYYENITKEQLLRLLRELKTSEYLDRIDSFFLCIQTHGDLLNNHTVMEFSDGSQEYTDVIVSMFSNVECKALIDKPKVFFFPFCRGKISDQYKNFYEKAPRLVETDGAIQRDFNVPTISDILICYGTVPGFKVHRDTEFGSWYVTELCKVFAEYACSYHLEEMLKLVASNTMRTDISLVQVASTESRGFNRVLFLNPKISDS